MAKCVKCGKEVISKFCGECGTSVQQISEVSVVEKEYIVGKKYVPKWYKDKVLCARAIAGAAVAIGLIAIVIARTSTNKEIARMEKANYEKAMQGTPVDPKSAKEAMQGIVDKYAPSSTANNPTTDDALTNEEKIDRRTDEIAENLKKNYDNLSLGQDIFDKLSSIYMVYNFNDESDKILADGRNIKATYYVHKTEGTVYSIRIEYRSKNSLSDATAEQTAKAFFDFISSSWLTAGLEELAPEHVYYHLINNADDSPVAAVSLFKNDETYYSYRPLMYKGEYRDAFESAYNDSLMGSMAFKY